MQKRRLGKLAIDVSVIGLGTVKFGRNQAVKYPEKFALPEDHAILDLLSMAKDHGVNLLDTAPAYGESELRLGKLLTNRHDWVICTKVGEEFTNGESHFDFSTAAVIKSIDRSLQRLKTDYLDVVLVHSNGDDEKLIMDDEIFVTLDNLKTQGKIRGFGMSSKTIPGGMLTIQHADVAMITYHPAYIEEQCILDEANKLQKGIFIKKAFASGHLQTIGGDNPIQHALSFCLQHQGVSSVMVGTINPKHLMENIEAVHPSSGSGSHLLPQGEKE